jgi:hypothetical protein
MKTRKTTKALNTKAAKIDVKHDTSVEGLGVKAAITKASASVQSGVAKTEIAVLAAAERMEEGLGAMKASLDGAKQFGNEIVDVADNAGRTALGSVVAMNGSLVNYGREAINDTIETGRRTFEVKSFKDAIELQTEFTERRLKAMFHTLGAINSLAHTNTMAMWSPLADMLRSAGDKGDETMKAGNGRFKSMM